jgi:hypothetical protein
MDEWTLCQYCEDWFGLSHYEDWGRWSAGKQVRFVLREPMRGRTTVIVRCSSVVPTFHGHPVELAIDGHSFRHIVTHDTPTLRADFRLTTPSATLDLRIPEPVRPKDIGLSPDTRELGICVNSLTIRTEC